MTAEAAPRPFLQEHEGWLYFAAVSGEAGRAWVQEFRRPECFEIVSTATRALPLFHRRELERGRRLLEEAEAGLLSLREGHPSIRFAVEQIYYPLLAYYHYRVEEFALARENLGLASVAVASAIAREPFLIPLAFRCSELELHHARIARHQRRWEAMGRHIDTALKMVHGGAPFCALPDGTEIALPEIQAFFRGLPPLAPEMAEFSRTLTDDALRHRVFDQFILGIYAIPGFVIGYP